MNAAKKSLSLIAKFELLCNVRDGFTAYGIGHNLEAYLTELYAAGVFFTNAAGNEQVGYGALAAAQDAANAA